MVPPNGLSRFARSTSTWIHCMSPVHCANASMRAWSTTTQLDTPSSRPTKSSIVLMLYSLMFIVFSPRDRSGELRAQPLLVHLADARLLQSADELDDLRYRVL